MAGRRWRAQRTRLASTGKRRTTTDAARCYSGGDTPSRPARGGTPSPSAAAEAGRGSTPYSVRPAGAHPPARPNSPPRRTVADQTC